MKSFMREAFEFGPHCKSAQAHFLDGLGFMFIKAKNKKNQQLEEHVRAH